MSRNYLIILFLLLISSTFLTAQNESLIDYDGIIFPRLTTLERNNLNAQMGQCIYNTDNNLIECYDGTNWKSGIVGFHCWDLNSNGVNDPSEDINNDGSFNTLDCVGADGPVGATGATGATGAAGPPGMDGIDGADGAQGPPGTDGLDGATGATGPQGPPGMDGIDGNNGINCWDSNGNGTNEPAEDTNGDGLFNSFDCQGAPGATGATGAQGPPGMDGIDGTDGVDGAQGPPGIDGQDGATGATGATGAQGPSGMDGIDGMDGVDGADGADGPPGMDGVDGNNGINCWDSNGNGTNEPAEDTNGDGLFNSFDCQGAPGATGAAGTNGISCWDSNGNGINDPAEDLNGDGNFNNLDCQSNTALVINYLASLPDGIENLLSMGETPFNIWQSGIAYDSIMGTSYQGGLIFYIDTLNIHPFEGLIGATADIDASSAWGCLNNLVGGTSKLIGTGEANTTMIVNASCPESYTNPAQQCFDAVIGGYDDWYLPSIDELEELDKAVGHAATGSNHNIINIVDPYNWSSSEANALDAWAAYWELLGPGVSYFIFNGKGWNTPAVRPVRSF